MALIVRKSCSKNMFNHRMSPGNCRCCRFLSNMGGSTDPLAQLTQPMQLSQRWHFYVFCVHVSGAMDSFVCTKSRFWDDTSPASFRYVTQSKHCVSAELIKQFITRRGRNKVGTRLTNSKCCLFYNRHNGNDQPESLFTASHFMV